MSLDISPGIPSFGHEPTVAAKRKTMESNMAGKVEK
jgi:hypothetical protein